MKNKERALVKDLELQIDYLIGYSPSGNHWKQEWTIRNELINQTLGDKSTPDNIVDKILRIQAKLYDLRNGIGNSQTYLQGKLEDYVDKPKHQVQVTDMQGNISYFNI